METPRLKNDCFALPPGGGWTPVDMALQTLRARLACVVGRETLALGDASGRVLAKDIMAKRSNPPLANSAMDGYGFAFSDCNEETRVLSLVEGRSAAGAGFDGCVPANSAVRILTGAPLPKGVDTVVMQEDVTRANGEIAFGAGLKKGANTRQAGEDVRAGDPLFSRGRVLTPQDFATAAAMGIDRFDVFKKLRVGVLSTGDELCAVGGNPGVGGIFDANRPMLLAVLERWGMVPVDLGPVGDDRAAVRARLNDGATRVDAVLTSGGASAGDEDHISAILKTEGSLATWRIAIKPGRPLALGQWNGVPVFGLPGNPVAAFVCALVFARPALNLMAGADWISPRGFDVPAAFAKNKKAGRREYLRARLNENGHAEVYPSEGSGRISSLSWADGLVELADDAAEITTQSHVRYVPYASFGL